MWRSQATTGTGNIIKSAVRNAADTLARKLSESTTQRKLLDRTAELLELESPPRRIEVYDNSHISGSNPSV